MAIPAGLRRAVVTRALDCCEYCGLAQAGQEAAFHSDHVKPVAAGGPPTFANLALACVSCSLRKGARQWVDDPTTGQQSRIYNPRTDSWREHFRWNAESMVGLTPIGRATIATLEMNRPLAQAIRQEEALRNRHPPLHHR